MKQPIVLLHGLTANGACWNPIAAELAKRFDVVMPDARGHGRSEAPLHGYRYEDHASDVASLIEHLELKDPVLLGHSMGGMTAAVAATTLGTAVKSVILVDPTFISPQRQRDVRDSDVAEQHRRTLGMSIADIARDIRARHPHRSAEIVERLAEARLQTRMSAFDVLTPPNPEYRALVAGIEVLIMLIVSDGGVVSPETAKELEGLNPRVRTELVKEAGHGIPYDRPAQVVAAVESFCGVSTS